MVNFSNKRTGDLLLLANGLVLLVLINVLASEFFFRIDLTEEKRFSIKKPTQEMLNNLEDKIYVTVYLDGELNSGFRRLQKSIRETLEELRIYSDDKIQFEFVNPSTAMSQKAREEYMKDLMQKGIVPTNVVDPKDGQVTERIIFPGAIVSDEGSESTGRSIAVNFLKVRGRKQSAEEADDAINQSIETVEYELASAIDKLTGLDRKRIGLVTGHGELDSLEIASFNSALLQTYNVVKVDIANKKSLERYDVLVIAKPTRPYSESDKYKLDQYIMRGGKVLFLIDKLEASMDSASREGHFAFPYNINLDDQLFKYGIRLNLDLVQDRLSGKYPVVTNVVDGKPQMQLMDWPFFPLINRYADHSITRNLDAVVTKFISTVDTVKAPGVKKTPLLFTSQYSRNITAPVPVSINEIRKNLKAQDYTLRYLPVGYLLEGSFTSLYKNRFAPQGVDETGFKEQGVKTKLIVIADGDLARNDVNPRNGQPQQLGYDPFAQYTFANEELLMNAINYLVDGDGLIAARNKEVKIRPLDKEKIRTERTKWQAINLALPLLLILAYGVLRAFLRKRKYSSF